MRTVFVASCTSRKKVASPTTSAAVDPVKKQARQPLQRQLEQRFGEQRADDDAHEQRGEGAGVDRAAREVSGALSDSVASTCHSSEVTPAARTSGSKLCHSAWRARASSCGRWRWPKRSGVGIVGADRFAPDQ
ncbi:MAG: hypothetical protein ABIX12_01050 [Rubrivivax sp.]